MTSFLGGIHSTGPAKDAKELRSVVAGFTELLTHCFGVTRGAELKSILDAAVERSLSKASATPTEKGPSSQNT